MTFYDDGTGGHGQGTHTMPVPWDPVMLSNYGNLLPTYVVVAVIYIIINMLLNSLSTYLERKLRTRRGGRRVAIIQAGTESDLLERQEIVVLDAPGVDEFNK